MASTGSKRQSLRLLMMASAVVSIVLCLGTAMLGRSVVRLQAVDTGIDARDVQTFRVALPESRSPDEVRAFYRGLLPDIAAFSTDHLSGASAALPTVENDMRYGLIASGDAPTFNDGVGHLSVVQSVTPDYFAALRVHLITGRSISAADTNGAEPAAVVTEPVARALWATTDPVGKHIRLGPGASEVRTVVGVVSGIRQHAIDEEPGWGVYLSHAQFPARAMSVVFRSSASRNDIAALVERAVSSHDSTVVAFALQPMTAVLSASEYPRRLYFAVFLTLAVLSLAVLFAVTYVSAIVAGQDREPRRVTRLAPNERSLDMSAERLFLAMSVVASVVLAPVVARGLGGALADIGWFDWPSVVLASLSVVVGMTLARQVARRL